MRALIGIALFASAYMAEVVRAGLQAIPRGQFEGAMAVGLKYPQMMRLVVLPQALKITIPNIVNTYIGLFKDTTLVFIVGIFDFLRTVEDRAHRSEMGDARDLDHRLRGRRHVLSGVLLRHVALRARHGSAACARRGARRMSETGAPHLKPGKLATPVAVEWSR